MTEEEFFELSLTMLDIDGVTPTGIMARDDDNDYLVTMIGTQKVTALFTYEPDVEITCHFTWRGANRNWPLDSDLRRQSWRRSGGQR